MCRYTTLRNISVQKIAMLGTWVKQAAMQVSATQNSCWKIPVTFSTLPTSDDFSGPGRVIGRVCVCVRKITSEIKKVYGKLVHLDLIWVKVEDHSRRSKFILVAG